MCDFGGLVCYECTSSSQICARRSYERNSSWYGLWHTSYDGTDLLISPSAPLRYSHLLSHRQGVVSGLADKNIYKKKLNYAVLVRRARTCLPHTYKIHKEAMHTPFYKSLRLYAPLSLIRRRRLSSQLIIRVCVRLCNASLWLVCPPLCSTCASCIFAVWGSLMCVCVVSVYITVDLQIIFVGI